MKNVFDAFKKHNVELEIRHGFGQKGYCSLTAKVDSMRKKDIPQLLATLDATAARRIT